MKKLIYISLLGISSLLFAQMKVGDNLSFLKSDAMLEVESSTKGFLPPRMDKHARDLIVNPEIGLMIYNTDDKCINTYKTEGWFNYCNKSTTVPEPDFWNIQCYEATVSVTPCGGQTSLQVSSNTYNLVEINGQCWFADHLKETPSNYPEPTVFNSGEGGWYGYFYNVSSEPTPGEGKLYQWNAAMNGSTQERAQGICPSGWHIPSDCEFKYLENSLGMTIEEQNNTNGASFWRGTNQATQLKSVTSLIGGSTGGTNSSGFNALLTGYLDVTGFFEDRGLYADIWTSTATTSNTSANYLRGLDSSSGRVYRAGFAS